MNGKKEVSARYYNIIFDIPFKKIEIALDLG
jgi:hypothetical protein